MGPAWRKLHRYLLPAILVGSGILLGLAMERYLLHVRPRHDYPIHAGGGAFTNPLLDFEIVNTEELQELRPFETEIRSLIDRIERQGKVETVAVYFRDLNNGPWFGAREERRFVPGSLFKVPLVIACMREVERDPAFLKRMVKAVPPAEIDLSTYHFPPPVALEPGRDYTVQELIERTCRFSDNLAAYLLARTVDREIMKDVLLDLGLDAEKMKGEEISFSAKEYGRFFRILYNASYLSRESSEYLLSNFAQGTFREGLVAGVPNGTAVAHKFGENTERRGSGRVFTLHDAGIVYHRQRPYLLCVMTLGTDLDVQASAIAACSSLVWNKLNEQKWTRTSD